MSSYIICAIRLQNNKWFIETVPDKYWQNDICNDCQIKYEFVRNNKPGEVIEYIQLSSDIEIDYYVKKYMKFYGIDNVRGGSYSNTTMSVDTIHHIHNEIAHKFIDIDMEYATLNKIYDTYSDIHKWKKTQVIDEIYKLNNTYQQFRQESALLNKLRNAGKMNRDILHDLQWLCNRIVYYTNNSLLLTNTGDPSQSKYEPPISDIIRYKDVLAKLQMLYAMYTEHIDDGGSSAESTRFEPKLYLMQPKMIFDTFFYHADKTELLKTNFEISEKMVNFYEYVYYRIINRTDELTFDVNSYGYKYEDQFKFTLAFLQQYCEA
jgi:hypothetical protein